MLKFTANYVNTNNNFVFQNISFDKKEKKQEYLGWLYIIKNILQRWTPTRISNFLAKELKISFKEGNLPEVNLSPLALISNEIPDRQRIIKGDQKKNNFPAKKFFDNIPRYLWEDFAYIQQLLCPEVRINDITQEYVEEFEEQQVDFFLPHAFLVIEIDGSQHVSWPQKTKDEERDIHLKKFWIKVFRITTKEIEENNESFKKKIEQIKKYIIDIQGAIKDKFTNVSIWLDDYKKSFENSIDTKDMRVWLSAIIRFQLLLISLLEYWYLSFNKPREIDLKINENLDKSLFALAIEDLFVWFENIYNLQWIIFNRPKYQLDSKSKNNISVDFSILKRYTDENQTKTKTIFVRNDYFDYYMKFPNTDAKELKHPSIISYDYIERSCTKPIKYKINEKNKNYLLFFLKNIFWYDNFNDGQYPIIQNILENRDTIWLLPTWWGKSLCFHLSCLLQPGISFVVCPIKSLMYDQVEELKLFGITRISCITSDIKEYEKDIILSNFSNKKYAFIFISPERFQNEKFREAISKVENITYSVIDEIHCLSERWHQFRTSYLCLVSTIRKYCPWSIFLWLTATASSSVLNDIKQELGIENMNDVKTLTEFHRPELEFIVIDDEHKKTSKLNELLIKTHKESDLFSTNKNAAIIFTSFVSHKKKWCYVISKQLPWYSKSNFEKRTFEIIWMDQNSLENKIKRYSWSIPKKNKIPIMKKKDFDDYKMNVQRDFKGNKFPVLVATKAFGMWVNKKNIYCTFHYGIPSSMEALYQEWGRAWRDKSFFSINNQAKCYVLLWKENKNLDELSETVFDPNKQYEDIIDYIPIPSAKSDTYDIFDQLLLWKNSLDSIEKQSEEIQMIYEYIKNHKGEEIIIDENNFSCKDELEYEAIGVDISTISADTEEEPLSWEWDSSDTKLEKSIFRLMQLWIIDDYTITWFTNKKFTVTFKDLNEEDIKKKLWNHIYNNMSKDKKTTDEYMSKFEEYDWIEKYIMILLQRSYDTYANARRQSLKNLYENCLRVVNWEMDNKEFKNVLEAYFKFWDDTFIMQDIADNVNKNIFKWSDVFYETIKKNDTYIKTDEVKSLKKQKELKALLWRLLESYQKNIWLNLISWMVRLFLDQYNDVDGKGRFEEALEEINTKDEETKEELLNQIIKLWKQLPLKNQTEMLNSILSKVNLSRWSLINLYDNFQNEEILNMFLSEINQKFLSIKEIQYDWSKKTW